jgi:predicted deacetylase
MFYAPEFWFKTYQKVLDDVEEKDVEEKTANAIVVFYHVEAEDPDKRSNVLTRMIKNIKWLAGKFKTKNLVLHSFNHLSSSKAPPDFSHILIEDAKARLTSSGFKITETPFGYLNEWKIHVAGESLAKVFKEF